MAWEGVAITTAATLRQASKAMPSRTSSSASREDEDDDDGDGDDDDGGLPGLLSADPTRLFVVCV